MKSKFYGLLISFCIFVFSTSMIFAQETTTPEAESTAATLPGPMLAMLLLGLGVILAVGMMMASRDAAEDGEK